MDEFGKLVTNAGDMFLAIARTQSRQALLDAFKDLRDNGGDVNKVIAKLEGSLKDAQAERQRLAEAL